MTATIHHGDCLDVLRAMPDNSVDAICTDPPYGLSNTTPEKVTDTIVRWARGDREHVPTGKGFMGASWDAFVPPVAVWDECLRVLKPGGHLVAFAGSRTQDLMGLSIRLAGFDIRDSLAWLYSQGFPKSLDVSKAIDKAYGAEREVIGRKTYPDGTPVRAASAESKDPAWRRPWMENGGSTANCNITVSATDDARQWEGWHTALKPAHEPIILARKPLGGKTVAANTLEWGTGGLNIEATRIPAQHQFQTLSKSEATKGVFGDGLNGSSDAGYTDRGRWPPNVVLDPDAAGSLDMQSGEHRGGASMFFKVCEPDEHGAVSQHFPREFGDTVEPDPPFLYAAKAPKKERPSYVNEDGRVIQHGTVKPLSIAKWLCRLTCPPGGTILDPFAGSGTTIEAAMLEGFNVIGIEREAEYLPLIQQRIDRANGSLPMAS